MSFGYDYRIDVIDDAIKEAVRQEIIIFAAAANHGARNKIAWPANSSHVICVHAANGFCSSSTFTPAPSDGMPNFTILGEAVESFWISDSGDNRKKHNTMKRKSGTSFAAPILAAYCATILYYVRLKFAPARQRLITYAKTKEGMVAILRHPGLLERKKSLGYSVVIPWGLKTTSLHDQLVERLEGKGRHTE